MTFGIVPFQSSHYGQARELWQRIDGIGLSEADEEEPIGRYLVRNPETSFVAIAGGRIVGTVLCGHDGRRGLVHHLAVAIEWRRQGVGRALLSAGLAALEREGIHKCHLLVFASNESGLAFWSAVGAQIRHELRLLSLATASAA